MAIVVGAPAFTVKVLEQAVNAPKVALMDLMLVFTACILVKLATPEASVLVVVPYNPDATTEPPHEAVS